MVVREHKMKLEVKKDCLYIERVERDIEAVFLIAAYSIVVLLISVRKTGNRCTVFRLDLLHGCLPEFHAESSNSDQLRGVCIAARYI